ncbi:hypothetical protein ACCO45_001164 [Purpureocillium lilacinum]|uniref:Uncharacterized protein n=1 Tax=Purpureocillium lilacinum TaxID=33203 RepID=A0ACC4E902_PURLI
MTSCTNDYRKDPFTSIEDVNGGDEFYDHKAPRWTTSSHHTTKKINAIISTAARATQTTPEMSRRDFRGQVFDRAIGRVVLDCEDPAKAQQQVERGNPQPVAGVVQ